MTEKDFMQLAERTYNESEELQKLEKNEFLELALQSYKDFLEFLNADNMPVSEFEEKYINTNLASYGIVDGKGEVYESADILFKNASILVVKEPKDNDLIIVITKFSFATIDKNKWPIVRWNLKDNDAYVYSII